MAAVGWQEVLCRRGCGRFRFCRVWGYVYASAYAGALPGWYSVGFYWGGDMWSLAVYKGRLFMGYNNGGRGTVLAIRAVCLSLGRLMRF